ncbi:hypothetical protein P615_00830 [Brevibacillus laterosporus PE36]|nr:hypothetical protein P615_00830 [Brevibacillus laterosporus PE36]
MDVPRKNTCTGGFTCSKISYDHIGIRLCAHHRSLFIPILSGDQLTPFLPALLSSPQLLDVKTLFFSILLEAIPFVLIGVFFSALLQTFVRDETV